MSEINIDQQIACVKRELTMRGTVYTHQVARGKMKSADATREIETMRAVLQTLLHVQAGAQFRETGR
jgi:hypothetical protein